LHQRLKLLKKGEKLEFWGEQEQDQDQDQDQDSAGLSVAAVEKLVACGADLSPEVTNP